MNRPATGHDEASPRVDPITAEVLRNALRSAAEQMKVTLRRASFSPILYEGLDFACGLYDRQVRLLAQANTLPLFLGTMNWAIEKSVAAAGGVQSLRPGDVLFNSYGYDVGSHSQDAALIVPAFVDDELVGYAVTKAHLADLGAKSPWAIDSTDNFQEGVAYPGVRLYRAGERQDDIYRTLLANSRMPEDVSGDIAAQLAAARSGVDSLCGLVRRFGLDVFEAHVEHIFAHAEAIVRDRLASVSSGRYSATGAPDSAQGDAPLEVQVTVEIAADGVVIDVLDVPDEQPTCINCPRAATESVSRFAVLSALVGNESVNEGHLRVLTVRTRPGSMYEPIPPAPIFMYFTAAALLMDVVHRAVGLADRTAVPAGSAGDICGVAFSGYDEHGHLWNSGNDHLAGQGARSSGDGGPPLMHISCAGGRTGSAEVFESKFPIQVERMELATDSGGSGEYAGGCGVIAAYRLMADTYLTAVIERTQHAPWGLEGGGDALPNRLLIIEPDGTSVETRTFTDRLLVAGTLVSVETGGGGGFGDPRQRPAESVHEDVRNGYISQSRARSEYPHAFLV